MIEEKIRELGLELSEAPKPLAAYVPALAVNNMVMTAGQVPLLKGDIIYKGKLGKDVDIEDGKKAAELCALNCLSVIKGLIGNLDKIDRILKITAFINSSEGFTSQPEVANGASELMIKLFGDNGKHVRSAVGVNELPRNAAVEIEMIVSLK